MADTGDDSRSKEKPADDGRRVGRRGFFLSGLREMMKPLVDSLDERLTEINSILPGPSVAPRRKVPLTFLRPPGALDEAAFLNTCSRCAVCVSACPAYAIKLDRTNAIAGGAPYIDADTSACVVCSTLECMTVCPSGALVPTPIRLIDMGTAKWNPNTCVRTRGDSCTICIDECPIGEFAIKLDEAGSVKVNEEGCVGCGLCQARCPTSPKSIVVEPKAARV